LVEVFEQALGRRADKVTGRQGDQVRTPVAEKVGDAAAQIPLGWQDAVRCLELDDAARRSVEKRRASSLEYQEVTEEAGFKGTMTLVGSLVLLIMSFWVPWAGWLIAPLFGVFLVMQGFRWAAQQPADFSVQRHRGHSEESKRA
jgi:hypothetical protein